MSNDRTSLIALVNSIRESYNQYADSIISYPRAESPVVDESDSEVLLKGLRALRLIDELVDAVRDDAVQRGLVRDIYAAQAQRLSLSVIKLWALLSASGMPDGIIANMRPDFEMAVSTLEHSRPENIPQQSIMYEVELPF